MPNNNVVLVTCADGLLGFHLPLNPLKNGDSVIGICNLNDYYRSKTTNEEGMSKFVNWYKAFYGV